MITVGQTLTVTDILKINQGASKAVEAVRTETSKKGKSKNKFTPTGTVVFEDGDTIIGQAKVKLVRQGCERSRS